MIRQETIERIMAYVRNLTDMDIDPEIVRKGLSLFYLHRDLENLVETYVVKRYGLSYRQVDTLTALFHKQDKSLMPAQLAEEVRLSRSAMTSNLDSLQRKGYLERVPHPNDRRKIVIRLTEKGLELCDKIMPIRYQDMAIIMKRIPLEVFDLLQNTYQNLMKAIQEMMSEEAN